MYFFINNTNNKPCLLAVHWTSVRLLLAVSIGNLLDFHWFGCGFAVSPLEVHWKNPLDFVVQPKMPRQAPENHRKNTVVKKQKNMDSAYPQSNGVCSESAQKSSGSVKTSPLPLYIVYTCTNTTLFSITTTAARIGSRRSIVLPKERQVVLSRVS